MPPYKQALDLLRRAASPQGFVAYPDASERCIKTRDAVICGLAALMSEDPDLVQTFKNSLSTIFLAQHPTGFLPDEIWENGSTYGHDAGKVDSLCWAVLGLGWYTRISGDASLAQQLAPAVHRSLSLMDAWEFNGRHLVYVPLGGSWASEYIGHGYLLSVQLLRLWACEMVAGLYSNKAWKQMAAVIRQTVEASFWKEEKEETYSPGLHHLMHEAAENHWQMGFNPARVYPYFDQLGNALALFLKLGTPAQQQSVAHVHEQLLEQSSGMLPCFYPEITLEHPDFRELSHHYTDRFRNYPGQFYNGGLWPVWNGLSVAALQAAGKIYAAMHLQYRLEQACALHQFSFPECVDAATGMPLGNTHCAASAAALIIGQKAMEGKTLF